MLLSNKRYVPRIAPEHQKILANLKDTKSGIISRLNDVEILSDGNMEHIESLTQALLNRVDNEKNPILKQALNVVKNIILQ